MKHPILREKNIYEMGCVLAYAMIRIPVSMEVATDSRGRATLGSRFADRELQIMVKEDIDLEELPVYFVRHKLALDSDGIANLVSNNRFGIDWGVGPITHKSVYKPHGEGAVKDINAMKRIEEDGGLVCAAYEQVTDDIEAADDIVWIGIVPPHSEIESHPYSAGGDADHIDGDEIHIKTHQMHYVTEVSKEEAPKLFEGRPRGSIRRWRAKSDEVREQYRSGRD